MRIPRWSVPVLFVVLGLVTSLLSTRFDGGFLMGFFQGATIALMVGAAYLFWALVVRPGRGPQMWRPSDDTTSDDILRDDIPRDDIPSDDTTRDDILRDDAGRGERG